MTVAMVDPSLFTIPYDCALVYAMRELGEETTLYGRPLRSGEELRHPIRLVKQFYCVSEILPRLVRKPIKGAEHALDMCLFAAKMAMIKPLAIHFQWCPLPVIDAEMVKLLRRIAPAVMTVHDPNPYNGTEYGIMAKGARELPRLFDAVIVHSRSGKEQIVKNGVNPDRVYVIPHGPLELKASPNEAKSNRFTIIFFGKIKPYKGLDTLVEALGRLSPILKRQVHLIVVGEPVMDVSEIQSAAQRHGISASWQLGFVAEDSIDFWLRQSDLFVFPYRDIDASGVFMSCLKYGKPVIATRTGVFGEVLQDGTHGYLIDPGQPAEAFTAAIADLMIDPELARRMGTEVGQLMNTLPSWPSIARSTMNVYSEARGRWRKKNR
jgi:glycosyltransferase involved in cell wall biosynthesis